MLLVSQVFHGCRHYSQPRADEGFESNHPSIHKHVPVIADARGSTHDKQSPSPGPDHVCQAAKHYSHYRVLSFP